MPDQNRTEARIEIFRENRNKRILVRSSTREKFSDTSFG